MWKIPGDPDLDCGAFAKHPSIHYKQRHFVLGIELQIFGLLVLILSKIQRSNFKFRVCFGERDVRSKRTRDRGVVQSDFHWDLQERLDSREVAKPASGIDHYWMKHSITVNRLRSPHPSPKPISASIKVPI